MEFSLLCPRCDRPLPLDGPLETAHCTSCQSDIDIPREYWTDTLTGSCRMMQEVDIGIGTGSMLIGTFHGNLTLARFDPYCDACKTDFSDPWDLSPGTSYTCSKCGVTYPVLKPPAWLAAGVPRIRMLINALVSGDSPGLSAAEGTRPVSITCPSCSGHLEVDGTDRFVRCRYCSGQVYLPDDLWLRFHGTKRKRRWFVVCEYTDDGE